MGRPKTGDGRTVAVNFYLRPSVKQALFKISKETGYSMAMITDAVLAKFLAVVTEQDVKNLMTRWNKAYVNRKE